MTDSIQKPVIFLVHGIYFHGSLMKYMQIQLADCGYQVHTFSYKSVTRPIIENAERLGQFVQTQLEKANHKPQTIHFVGHSLGGLLIRLAYEQFPEQFSGRIVTLGTPHNGSATARVVAQSLHERLIGGAYENALDGDLPAWRGQIELGSIAGSIGIGPGRLVTKFNETNDGTVALSETQLENQADHIILPMSHTGLVYSKRAAQQTDYFLKHGKFNHNAVK